MSNEQEEDKVSFCPHLLSDQIELLYGADLDDQLRKKVAALRQTNAKWRSVGWVVASEPQTILEKQVRALQDELAEMAKRLAEAGSDGAKREEEFKKKLQELQDKQSLQHLTSRVCKQAEAPLVAPGSALKATFDSSNLHPVYVMSIDIRRSTELMLKARQPELFARFITDLCDDLAVTIVDNLGVFDKFTGDGILAFFPEFFSGPDAGFYAVKAADECHKVFARHYSRSRGCFMSVIKDTGLGIGIDYGEVKLVRVREGLTVVGTPVVYACRMGGAKAGETFLNQPAYEEVFTSFSAYCNLQETEIDIKHEGKTVAYKVWRNEKQYTPRPPDWLSRSEPATTEQPAEAGG